MARTHHMTIDGGEFQGTPNQRISGLVSRLNDRLVRIKDVMDANEGSALNWEDGTLPTAAIQFAGRFLYHNRGQGATPDNLYICLWNGSAWAWVLIA